MKTDTLPTEERMNGRKPIWVFTPSRTDPKDLEFILVQRQQLLQDAVERVKESALTDHKHHLLFVGPRGCGKTHLITLIVSRLSKDDELTDRLRIAWLNEDETCTTLLDLLFKIHAALEKRYAEEYNKGMLNAAYDMKQDAALEFMSKHLLSSLGSRTLLVAVENLDAIFDGLGNSGQKQLRAFIQENPKLCLVATAQRLVEDLSSRTSPFFGFFQTEHLKPLNVTEATELLQNIARLHENGSVVEFLSTSRGRSRIRALHHLSGGNHRIYIVLSQFITRDSIDALVGPFMRMVDELTPYYQERLRWLPPLQRKIIEYLCSCEGTVPVKEIAKKLFATPQTISSQLQDLREKGYVEANQRGRESLYEISEPLMRICVEVKDSQRHQPLRLLVDFLRVWYDDQELKHRLGKIEPSSASCTYLESAIQRNSAEGNLRKRIFLEELQSSLAKNMKASERDGLIRNLTDQPEAVLLAMNSLTEGNKAEAINCLDEAIALESSLSGKIDLLIVQAGIHSALGNHGKEIDDYTKVIEMPGATVEQVADALVYRGFAYDRMGETQHAIDDYTAVIELSGATVDQVAKALFSRGASYGKNGELKREIADYTAMIALAGLPVKLVAMALVNRGIAYDQAGEIPHAIEDLTEVIGLAGIPVEAIAKALHSRGIIYGKSGENRRAIDDYTEVIGLSGTMVEQVAKAQINRGITFNQVGETLRAIDDYTAVIALSDAPAEQVVKALLYRGDCYNQKGELQRAIDDYTTLIGMPSAAVEQVADALINRGNCYDQAGQEQRAIDDYTVVIGLSGASVWHVAKALCLRGATLYQAGETQRGIDDYTTAIAHAELPVELAAMAHVLRGISNKQTGKIQDAIDDFTAVIGLSGVPIERIATAFYWRGKTFLRNGLNQEAQSDFEALIGLPTAPVEEVVDSYIALSELLFSEGRWHEGFKALEMGVECGSKIKPPYHESATDLISVIFSAGLNPEGRSDKVTELLRIYNDFQALPVLGEAVVQHIGRIFRAGVPFPSADNLEGWALAWEKAAESVAEFRLSVRLLRTGISFVKTGGKEPGTLLDLTSTERSILEQALGLAEKEPAE